MDVPKPVAFLQTHRESQHRFLVASALALGVAWLAAFLAGAWLHSMAAKRGPESPVVFILIGTAFGQVSAGAIWLAVGPGRLVARVCGAVVLLVSCLAILAGGFSLFSLPDIADLLLALCAASLAQFIVVQLPLWLLRMQFRLRLVPRSALDAEPLPPMQFSVWQMLLTTTAIALVLAILRYVAERVSPAGGNQIRVDRALIVFMMIAGFDLLLAWPALWGFLSPSSAALKIALAVFTAAVVSVVQYYVFVRILGPAPSPYVIWWLNLPQFSLLAAAFSATRLSGYVLVRETASVRSTA